MMKKGIAATLVEMGLVKSREQINKEREKGLASLKVLLPAAQGHSGQSRVIAHFLLCLYNGDRFKFDLTDFRSLDTELMEHCLNVLRMDANPEKEVHKYFENGQKIWEGMAEDYRFIDYEKLMQFNEK